MLNIFILFWLCIDGWWSSIQLQLMLMKHSLQPRKKPFLFRPADIGYRWGWMTRKKPLTLPGKVFKQTQLNIDVFRKRLKLLCMWTPTTSPWLISNGGGGEHNLVSLSPEHQDEQHYKAVTNYIFSIVATTTKASDSAFW